MAIGVIYRTLFKMREGAQPSSLRGSMVIINKPFQGNKKRTSVSCELIGVLFLLPSIIMKGGDIMSWYEAKALALDTIDEDEYESNAEYQNAVYEHAKYLMAMANPARR